MFNESLLHQIVKMFTSRAGRHEQLSPVLETVTDCLSSFLEILTYKGKIEFLNVEIIFIETLSRQGCSG